MKLITEAELAGVIKTQKQKIGSYTKIARLLGVSVAYVHAVASTKSHPGPAILEWLGYRRVVLYEKTGECNRQDNARTEALEECRQIAIVWMGTAPAPGSEDKLAAKLIASGMREAGERIANAIAALQVADCA